MKIVNCRVNHLKRPYIDSYPEFFWGIFSEEKGSVQKAYRIRVCLDEAMTMPVWDSFHVESTEQNCAMPENLLQPLTRYYYQIYVEDSKGAEIVSDVDYFESGKLLAAWKGKWITAAFCRVKGETAEGGVYLRKEFHIQNRLKNAKLVICGLGYFEAYINGQKCGDDFISTPYTDFTKQVQYRIFDVTDLINGQENALAVILGNGFYHTTTPDPWQSMTAPWRDVPKLLCELHLTYENGEKELVFSDNSWLSSKGPILFNGMRHGEHYDARLEQPGWDKPGFDAGGWNQAVYVRAPGGLLHVAELEPVRVRCITKPVCKWKTENGWVFDIGQNQSGIAHICFKGKRGDQIQIRYSDRIYADGRLDQEALASFNQGKPFHTDIYIKRSDEPEWWHPRFAYHGIQYLEISGNDIEPALEDIEVWLLCNDFAQRGHFHCDNEVINKIQSMCNWSTVSMCYNALISDTLREQTSWTGDTGLSCEQVLINFEADAMFRKWQQDLRDAQLTGGSLPCIIPSAGWGYNGINGPDWSHPIYEVPMQLYRYCGDVKTVKDNYEALKKYCRYLDVMAVDNLVNYGLGDWCPPFEGPAISVNMSSAHCPSIISDNAYYYSTLKAAQRCAELLGLTEDAQKFGIRAYEVKKAFRARFYDEENMLVTSDCQTATALMLYHHLCEEHERAGLLQKLVAQIKRDGGKLDFGVLGCKAVLNSLGEGGYVDLALQMILGPEYPSYGHWVAQGATTLWECWNGGGSHNHNMFSDVSAFFYKYVAGVMPAEGTCGWKEIVFRPAINSMLQHAEASVDTVRGRVSCSFQKKENTVEIFVELPVGCSGILEVPGLSAALNSGRHHFTKNI